MIYITYKNYNRPFIKTNTVTSMNQFRAAFSHIKTLPSAFWVVIGATLMNQVGNMAFVFLVLYLNDHLEFTLIQASLAFAAFSASTVVTVFIGGGLVDKLGAARIMTTALIANSLVLLIFPFIHEYVTIVIMCLVWGFVYGIYRPASQTFISHLSASGMHKVTFSLHRLVLNLGMSIGPAVGGYLASYSFSSIFWANSATNFLASLILIIGLSRTTWFNYRPTSQHKFELSIKWLKRDAVLRLFVIGMIPVSMIFFQHESTLAVFLKRDLHFSLSFYGWLFTMNTLLIVVCELPLNIATMHWPYRVNFILGSIFITAGFAGFYFATESWHVILLTIIWTIGEMILYPSASSYIAEIAPEHQRGSYMSLLNVSSNLGLLLGPWGGAIVMENFGAHGLWLACGLWGIVSVMIFNRLKEPTASKIIPQ